LSDVDGGGPAGEARSRLAAALRAGLAREAVASAGGREVAAAEVEVLVAVLDAAADRAPLERRFDESVAAARLEALREFAYGAGHEINNPLANIATRAQALLLDEKDPERRRRLAAIVDQAFRARDMIGGLMVFARPPKAVPAATAVDGILATVVEAVRPLAQAREARLECSPPPAPLLVFVDAAGVTEALRLLAVNALEAIASGGRVTLAAKRDGDGRVCEVTVSDDGPGMDADTLRRAFDPFFSGREAGRGLGLGLPKAWRLLTTNGGELVVDSRPGRGTRVTVRLPLAEFAGGEAPQPSAPVDAAEARR
jgi:signal transduction histidine kinase